LLTSVPSGCEVGTRRAGLPRCCGIDRRARRCALIDSTGATTLARWMFQSRTKSPDMDEGPSKYELLGPSVDRITVTLPIDRTCVPTSRPVTTPTRRVSPPYGPHFGPIPHPPKGLRERFLRVAVAARQGVRAINFEEFPRLGVSSTEPSESSTGSGRCPQRIGSPCGHLVWTTWTETRLEFGRFVSYGLASVVPESRR
jgi:hypothetical protein